MAVLSDTGILELIEDDGLDIDPFEPDNLTPNGIDLRIAEIVLPDATDAAPVTKGVVTVPPMTRFLVSTTEVVSFGPAVTGQLWIRSSYARRGIMAAFGKVEAGFSGTLTIGAFNASSAPVDVPIGDRFCQLAFELLDRPADVTYEGRSGNYQGQRGVTMAVERS